LYGAGQVIGVVELGGGYRQQELKAFFDETRTHMPSIKDVSVNGAQNNPKEQGPSEQVVADLEITGSIAPKANIRVYFARNSLLSWNNAIRRAVADHVTVLLVGWGETENFFTKEQMRTINASLELAASAGVTVVAPAGDSGVADGAGKRRYASFPASSPWVLAVGAIWDDQLATGSAISDEFDRPQWQSTVAVPPRENGSFGRSVPDVTASNVFVLLSFSGKKMPLVGAQCRLQYGQG